MLLEYCN